MIFLNSESSAAVLVFYLPFRGPCTQRWKTERGQSPEYILKFSKKLNIYEHPVYLYISRGGSDFGLAVARRNADNKCAAQVFDVI